MENKEVVFMCRKCHHHLFIENISVSMLNALSKFNCPNCGEDGELNWILSHVGNSEEEKKQYKWKQ